MFDLQDADYRQWLSSSEQKEFLLTMVRKHHMEGNYILEKEHQDKFVELHKSSKVFYDRWMSRLDKTPCEEKLQPEDLEYILENLSDFPNPAYIAEAVNYRYPKG